MKKKKVCLYNNKSECCGCGACYQVCPKGAIAMNEDEEGFKYPNINNEKCINCKLCEKVCPISNSEKKDDNVKSCYVAYTCDSVRIHSSSGGIFSVLSDYILEQEGIIAGAAFDSMYRVEHICIDNKEDLCKLRGSKYLQSDTKSNFIDIEKYLKDDRKVLFSGTECQVAALKKFLKKEYDNLYTIGVLCHGVPSAKVWDKYLEQLKEKYNSDIQNVFFRDKTNGWKTFSVNIEFNNNEKYLTENSQDAYMKLFLSDICMRPSCYDCQFKAINRIADITIGDCWGVERTMPEMDDDKGTSVVIIHSSKGEEIWEQISDNLKYKKAELDIVLPPYFDSRKSVKMHINRKKIIKALKRDKSFDVLIKYLDLSFSDKVRRKIKYLYNKMK